MSDITKDLEQIMQARYGRDVRQSIHDGIKDCHDDANMYAQETAAALEQIVGAVQAAETATSEAQTAASNASQATSEANEASESANSAATLALQATEQIENKVSKKDIIAGGNISITETEEGKLKISSTGETNIATTKQAGIVKATEDITVSEDGSMSLNTDFEVPEGLNTLVSGESWNQILGKIAKLTEEYMDNKILTDKIYPVGSIYMSVNDINPSELFGGTWIAWGAGRVPVGVNASDTEFAVVEQTGGEKTHGLTIAELASHTHTFTGSSVNTGHQSANHTHSIPALSGTALSSGAHTHVIGYNDLVQPGAGTPHMAGTDKTGTASDVISSAGAHTHSVTTNQSTTGNQSSNHTHSVTAKGTNSNTGAGAAHNNLQPYITCYMWKRIA